MLNTLLEAIEISHLNSEGSIRTITGLCTHYLRIQIDSELKSLGPHWGLSGAGILHFVQDDSSEARAKCICESRWANRWRQQTKALTITNWERLV
jgi:hypothetical protein